MGVPRRRGSVVVRVGLAVAGVCGLMGLFAAAAWSASGWTAYVVNSGGGTVTTFSTATNMTTGTAIPVGSGAFGSGPIAVAVTPDAKTAYVTVVGDGTVAPISTATNTAGAAITVGTDPFAVAVNPDGKTAYVINGGGKSVTPISTATNTAGAAITVGSGPDGVGVTPDGKTAYVANFNSNSVTPISTATNTAGAAITVGSQPVGVAVTPDGKTAYVANNGGKSVTPINTATNTAGAPITVGTNPMGVAVTPDGKTAYVTNFVDGTVTPINTATNTAGAPITVGTNPIAVAVTPDGKTAYITNNGSGTVTPINTATNTAGAAITVGSSPRGVAITPDQAPTAAFSVAAAPAGSPSSFDGSGSSSPVGSIASYRWDFGDGQSATTTTPLTTHVYATPGAYTARLTVTNTAGTSLTQVFTGQTVSLQGGPQASTSRPVTVAPAPPPAAVTPVLTQVAQTHSVWRAGNALATLARKTKRRPPVGTKFSFSLNEPASVSLTFTQKLGGRKVKGRCRAQTRKNRKLRACRRVVTRGTLTKAAHTGRNAISFQGRISRTTKLKPGRYTVTIVARAAGKTSTPKRLSFTISR